MGHSNYERTKLPIDFDPRVESAVPDAFIARARQLYLRHYLIPANEIDDVIGAARLDYLRASRGGRDDGRLFFVIARRRACDFCRRRRLERSLVQLRQNPVEIDQGRLEKELFERMALQFAGQHPRLSKSRFMGVVRSILNDATVAQACRQNGIPRGSQPRYRTLLKQCFGALRCQNSHFSG